MSFLTTLALLTSLFVAAPVAAHLLLSSGTRPRVLVAFSSLMTGIRNMNISEKIDPVRQNMKPLMISGDIIMTKGDKPIEAYLAKAGLRLTQLRVPTTDFGFTAPANATNGMVIQRLTRPSETLKSGDRILKIGGETIAGSRRAQMVAFAKVREKAEPGVPIPITVKRGEETLELRFTPEFASRMETRVEKMAFITPQQRMVRDALMKQATFRP